jgi:Zn-dependent protease with chaperone function
MSRREAALILPLVEEAAARLGLPNHPPVLVDDSNEPAAFAYTRHIVITRGFLEHFAYDREPISAILAHELVHWRNGDPISASFVRGVALPLYVVQAAAGSLLNQTRNSLLRFLLWTIFWPVFVTVRYLVVPMQATDSREAEYRADQGAVLAGYRAGMRHILSDLRRSFEGGRNGWTAAICASHPPHELRLERLEEPGRDYSLPEDGS